MPRPWTRPLESRPSSLSALTASLPLAVLAMSAAPRPAASAGPTDPELQIEGRKAAAGSGVVQYLRCADRAARAGRRRSAPRQRGCRRARRRWCRVFTSPSTMSVLKTVLAA